MQSIAELVPGDKVRPKANPGRIGTWTGRKREANGTIHLEIDFGPNDRCFMRLSQLERVPEHETALDLFRYRKFGGPADLSKIIITEKLSGDLTNIFYSMEVGNTEFLPHQFKPVMKFVESQLGRILIADEVGLGKTIEAIYIWKELQAREGARRFLVICPSMLREKWKRDLETKFGIDAEIVDAKGLIEKINRFVNGSNASSKSFVLITSLEGIRSNRKDWDSSSRIAKHKLCGLLDEYSDRMTDYIFDLVVIDEAHYLRNSTTASHRTAALFRENSAYLVLLSATPVQTSEMNLFNLLNMISPEEYKDYLAFTEMLATNSYLIELANKIKYSGDINEAREIFSKIRDRNILNDKFLIEKIDNCLAKDLLEGSERVDIALQIVERSLFSRFINRTRKRDVIENRIIRSAKLYMFNFTEYEKKIYDNITEFLKGKSRNGSKMASFALIVRQRQMTSSLPAAFIHWKEHQSMSELMWEDLGLENEDFEECDLESLNDIEDLANLPFDVEIDRLEKHDSKYHELRKQLKEHLQKNPRDKVLIFSFYRGTIEYLSRRLGADGFKVASLMGGMNEIKYGILDEFAKEDGPNILISSEVGAEGIDLQFCHTIINYDLPWNPMRLEQRIGRIDRIGQKSQKVFIYNIICQDTIEDVVLHRLYERIRIFENSIGDLEDIIGDAFENLALDAINPDLTEEDLKRRAEQTLLAIEEKRAIRNELENKAIDLIGFSDYLIRTINDARSLDRYVGPSDTLGLVEDFFATKYPGTKISPFGKEQVRIVKLSPQAKADLGAFIEKSNPAVTTYLHRSNSEILCIFDPHAKIERSALDIERIDAIHPLIEWIVDYYEKHIDERHPCSAIELVDPIESLSAGIYIYLVHLWSAVGWKVRKEIKFFVADINGNIIDQVNSEHLVVSAFKYGRHWKSLETANLDIVDRILDKLQNHGFEQFSTFEQGFISDNEHICEQQFKYVRKSFDRKINDLQEQIARLSAEGKSQGAKLAYGKLAKMRERLELQQTKIEGKRETSTHFIELAMGLIKNGG